jgi:hypothetical protein
MKWTILLILLPACLFAKAPEGFIPERHLIIQKGKTTFVLNIHEKLHPEDKKVILRLLKEYLGADITVIKEQKREIISEKFYLGFKGQIKMSIEFPDYEYNRQEFLSRNLCINLKCDLIYRGKYIHSYSAPSFWNHHDKRIPNEKMHLITKYKTLTVKKTADTKIRRNLYHKLKYELAYFGDPGEIVEYHLAEVENQNVNGTYFEKDQQQFYLKEQVLTRDQLQQYVSSTNADCAFTASSHSLHYCKPSISKKVFPDIKFLPIKTKFQIKGGESELELFDNSSRRQLSSTIIQDSEADAIFDPEHVTIYRKEFKDPFPYNLDKPSKYNWLNQSSSMVVEYYEKKKLMARVKFKNLYKPDSERLHELIVEGINPKSFKVYHWKADNQLAYVGEYSSELITALERTTERRIKDRPYYSIGTRFETKRFELTAPNALSYLRRNNEEAFSFYSLYGEWWAPESKFGFKGYFNIFTYQYQLPKRTNGSVNEYQVLASYRQFLNEQYSQELRYSAGVNSKTVLITDNTSLGNLKLFNIPFEVETLFRRKKYVFSASANYTRIFRANDDFDSFEAGDGSGFWYGIEGKAAYPVYKNIFLSLGMNWRKGSIDFSGREVKLNEMGFFLGVDLLQAGF